MDTWIKQLEDGKVRVLLPSSIVQDLEEVVGLLLPSVDSHIEKDEEVVVIESMKAAIDITSPAKGRVVSVNEKLLQSPELLNSSTLDEELWLYDLDQGL